MNDENEQKCMDMNVYSFGPSAPNSKLTFSYIFIHFHHSYIIVQIEMNEN